MIGHLLTNINERGGSVPKSARLSDHFGGSLRFHANGTTTRRATFEVQRAIGIRSAFSVATGAVGVGTVTGFVFYKINAFDTVGTV